MKRMLLRVPDEVHKRFKVVCTEKEISMNQAIINYMKREVEKADKKR